MQAADRNLSLCAALGSDTTAAREVVGRSKPRLYTILTLSRGQPSIVRTVNCFGEARREHGNWGGDGGTLLVSGPLGR